MNKEEQRKAIDRLEELLIAYDKNIHNDLKERWNTWKKDVFTPELYEVIGGLMSRQVSIAANFINNSSVWNGHIAPMIMRSLIDNYINFAWILKEPLERSRQFIFYGLGQEKLYIELYKAEFEDCEIPAEAQLMIDEKQKWIDQQQYGFLTDVSFKSWSEKTVRQMAEEIGCMDLYNFPYQQFSNVSHNMWNHVARYNLIESDNPLHKFSRKPAIYRFPPDVYYLELTTKYVAKLFSEFDKKFNHIPIGNSYKEFNDGFDKIYSDFSEPEK